MEADERARFREAQRSAQAALLRQCHEDGAVDTVSMQAHEVSALPPKKRSPKVITIGSRVALTTDREINGHVRSIDNGQALIEWGNGHSSRHHVGELEPIDDE